jgi:heme-degrading monooxygenase HmoA
MYATIRTYTGAPELADELAARAGDVEELMSTISGFQAYYLVRTDDGCATISMFDSASGADESSSRAAEYLREHAGEFTSSTPTIWAGDVLVNFGAPARV